MLDLRPATREMTALLGNVTDEQLAAPTPCTDFTLGDVIHHVSGLSQAFTAAAVKDLGPLTSQAPSPDAAQLGDDWRTRIPEELARLAEAWRDPEAWEGMTQAGGVELPAEVAGLVALNEVVIHGWDVARASGQPFEVDADALAACLEVVSPSPDEDRASDGIFGPVVHIDHEAPLLDRVIGLSGRNPAWAAR